MNSMICYLSVGNYLEKNIELEIKILLSNLVEIGQVVLEIRE